MAEGFDSDSCTGFKRRISELSKIEADSRRTVEEQNSNSHSPWEKSAQVVVSESAGETENVRIGCDFASEALNCGLKKVRCDSVSEANVVVQERPEIAEGNKIDSFFTEQEKEFDEVKNGLGPRLHVKEVEMDSLIENCKKGLGNSFAVSVENKSESFLENKENKRLVESDVVLISGAGTHVMEFADIDSLRCISSGGSAKMKKGFENSSQIGERLVLESKDTEKKNQNDNEVVRCALKIEVIDDTALIGTAKVENCCGNENGFLGSVKNYNKIGNVKNMIEENNEMKERLPRRRGKGRKQMPRMNGRENVFANKVEAQNSGEKNGGEAKKLYSRAEMEALRFANLDRQRKKWLEVYCGLGPEVVREYDSLVEYNRQRHIQVKFDPRQKYGKKVAAPAILGSVAAKGRGNHLKIFVL